MALILKDRVRESSTSSGTGSITLAGAFSGYQTFNSAVASGSTVYYTIHNTTIPNDGEWEVGVGTFTAPSTLSRDTVFSSSAGGTTKVSFSGSSTLEVFITQPAEQAVYINDATGKVEVFGNGTNTVTFTNVTADLFTGNGSAISAINASNVSSGTIADARLSSNVVTLTATQTLTNKFITPRVSSAASIASPLAWNSDNFDQYAATAQAGALTINADAGTPTNGRKIVFRFKDNGTARALTWTTGSSKSFRAVGVTLPNTTVVNKTVYVGCIFNTADDRWDAVAVAQEV